MSKLTLDHSQYYQFTAQCPWHWYENYVTQRAKKHLGQRDDALCVGTLVHNGLENFYLNQEPTISPSVIERVDPTKDALFLAHLLLDQYAQTYQADPTAKLHHIEEPIVIPATKHINILAKIDYYFYIEEDTTISTGWQGETAILTKGWWIKEHKTKSSYTPTPLYIKSWQANMQADFQLLTLSYHLNHPIQGILVNVLEKPNIPKPRRTCKHCKVAQPFNAYTITAAGKYKCQLCGHEQDLTPIKTDGPLPTCKFFRFPVTRTPNRLTNQSLPEIIKVGEAMLTMLKDGIRAVPPWRPNCVNWRQTCQYFELHNTQDATIPTEHPDFETIDAYAYIHR